MNTFTKKSAFGVIGVGAAGLLALGVSAPAMASPSPQHNDGGSYSSSAWHKTNTDILGNLSNETPIVVAPQVSTGDLLGGGVLSGGILNGDIADGNAVASGNDVTAPIASGNDTDLASGNDTSVADGSGNGNSVDSSVSDLLDVDGMVDGILDDIDLNTILQGR